VSFQEGGVALKPKEELAELKDVSILHVKAGKVWKFSRLKF